MSKPVVEVQEHVLPVGHRAEQGACVQQGRTVGEPALRTGNGEALAGEDVRELVAPATANTIAKLAHGLADDLVSTLCLATTAPIAIAPAMNHRMWTHPATRSNVATLRERGVLLIGPDEGAQACGEFGPGRLREPEAIVAALLESTP